VDDLNWVRWRLDRLAAARLLGPLTTELETDYQFLALLEHELVLEQHGRSRPSTDGDVIVFTQGDARMEPSAPGGEKD